MPDLTLEDREAARDAARQVRRQRRRSIRKLKKAGARHIADHEDLARSQVAMLARFEHLEVPRSSWRRLERCKLGRCGQTDCSAACWFGDRGHVNDLMLQAAELLREAHKPLYFVTIIDPHHFSPMGQLASFSIKGLMQSLRRRFHDAGELFEHDRGFGVIEIAVEVDEAGQEWWSPHVHLVIATAVPTTNIKEALKPRRMPPDSAQWGRQRWRPVVVKKVTDLANLLAYCAKRSVERSSRGYDDDGRRIATSKRVVAAQRVEHDLWLLGQRPSDRIFLRRMKRVHGRLALISRPGRAKVA